jgi:hypothetical protein
LASKLKVAGVIYAIAFLNNHSILFLYVNSVLTNSRYV